jgi:hypothetical protein
MKTKQLSNLVLHFMYVEQEMLDQEIAHMEEMLRIYNEKRNVLINSIRDIEETNE